MLACSGLQHVHAASTRIHNVYYLNEQCEMIK